MSSRGLPPPQLEASWQAILHAEWEKPYMAHLMAFLAQERASNVPIYPPKHQVFQAFSYSPYDTTRVVIIGQDPYHGAGQAHGLSFSVPPGVPPPPSLKNIFKELETDLHIPPPKTGCLIPWACQGVLLLNAVLTVRAGSPGSHQGKGWEQFTDAVVALLCMRKEPVIFVLWGQSAQKKYQHILENLPQNMSAEASQWVLTAAHPSPYSAYNGFFGCRHFSKINALLTSQGREPIKWEKICTDF